MRHFQKELFKRWGYNLLRVRTPNDFSKNGDNLQSGCVSVISLDQGATIKRWVGGLDYIDGEVIDGASWTVI